MSSHDDAVLAAARTKFSYVFNVLNLLLFALGQPPMLVPCMCVYMIAYICIYADVYLYDISFTQSDLN